MTQIPTRKIQRGALLCEASGHPDNLLAYLPEIKAKGYSAIEFFPVGNDQIILEPLCERALELGLSVWIITGYMKYQDAYLTRHPDQKMIFGQTISPDSDQDGLSMETWGCPFNPDFKNRYFKFLRSLCRFQSITRITVNDEAFLASGCYCNFCRQEYAREVGGEMPQRRHPVQEDWKDPRWRAYLQWRMNRWNDVHAEMAQVIRQANPTIRTAFMASPCVELWINPWRTGVDLSAMIKTIDGITADPYYTYHERHFDPAEAYLSEWCRLLHGIVPEDKDACIVSQGFSHPVFTRPLTEGDGLWSALIPPACGIRFITPYAYTFQKCSPVQKAYESCFKLDPYFERSLPLKYAAVVHGHQSEIYRYPLPEIVPHSYDGAYLMPITETLRHRGIPYSYVSDRDLDLPGKLDDYSVVILPEIACLSDRQAQALVKYVEGGGNVVILGDLGSYDETGEEKKSSLLADFFGVRLKDSHETPQTISLIADHPALVHHQHFDEIGAANYRGGAVRPVMILNKCRAAQLPKGAELLATYDAGDGSGAIAALAGTRGRVVWMGGIPSRNAASPEFKLTVLNQTPSVFASVVRWAAGEDPELRVDGWPPEVPMRRLRPFDARWIPTFEFFPLQGENFFMGVIVSYFCEPADFTLSLTVPSGKTVAGITELLQDTRVSFAQDGGVVTIPVSVDFNTKALVFAFELKPS